MANAKALAVFKYHSALHEAVFKEFSAFVSKAP